MRPLQMRARLLQARSRSTRHHRATPRTNSIARALNVCAPIIRRVEVRIAAIPRRPRIRRQEDDRYLAVVGGEYTTPAALSTTSINVTIQSHASLYPTLARIALDILPVPASSVSVERLFSRAKEVSTDRRSRLGPDVFEWLECLNYYWRTLIVDYARANSDQVEECEILDYVVMVEEDEMLRDLEDLVSD